MGSEEGCLDECLMAAAQAFREGLMGDIHHRREIIEVEFSGDLEVSVLARLGEGSVLRLPDRNEPIPVPKHGILIANR